MLKIMELYIDNRQEKVELDEDILILLKKPLKRLYYLRGNLLTMKSV